MRLIFRLKRRKSYKETRKLIRSDTFSSHRRIFEYDSVKTKNNHIPTIYKGEESYNANYNPRYVIKATPPKARKNEWNKIRKIYKDSEYYKNIRPGKRRDVGYIYCYDSRNQIKKFK